MLRLFPLFTLLIFLGCRQETTADNNTAGPPTAKKVSHTFDEFGTAREDPYFWLNDPTDPEVIQHLEAENAYCEQKLAHTQSLQDELYEELVARIEQKYESLPTKRNGYWYYVRYEEGNEYPYYCRKEGSLDAEEEILLNVNQMAEGHKIYRLYQYFVSPDNQTVAFMVDTAGDRRHTLYFKDLETGELLPNPVSNCSYGGAWANDSRYFFYTLNDKTMRGYRVMRHELGAERQDVEVFTEPDSTFSTFVANSWDERYIFVGSFSTTSSEFWFLNADQPEAQLKVIQARQKNLEYQVDSYSGEAFYIYNNHQAQNFKISIAPVNTPGLANWKDLVPHNPDVLVNDYTVREKYLVVQERSQALDKIRVINRQSEESYYVDFGEEVYTAGMYSPTDEYNSDSIRYNYQSLTTPRSTFGYNLATRERQLLKQKKVGGGFDGSLYETKRLWATAKDGTQIPMSIVYHKDMFTKDGENPCLLYSYGSYGSSSMPSFNSSIISLLDRGFVYAVAHIRGGQEMGRQWYEDGKLMKKKNTFTDFIDCGQYLVDKQYTSTEGLFAMGGSAGGMLMGAIANMSPDLFKGLIARVPWMDVISDMRNPDLPLTTLEYEEWGNPYEKKAYEYMLSWSPYDNVKPADYPAILATGGLNDTQVLYHNPAKWVQRIRENNTGVEPVLFKCNMGAGHAGESGRFARQEETAMVYSFMLDLVGGKLDE